MHMLWLLHTALDGPDLDDSVLDSVDSSTQIHLWKSSEEHVEHVVNCSVRQNSKGNLNRSQINFWTQELLKEKE